MLETARYEAERSLFGSLAVSFGLAAFAGMFLFLSPAMIDTVDWESFVDRYPASLVEAFGLRHLGTLGGILAAEVYKFGWVVVLGIYVTYTAAGSIVGDVETDRMDLLLAGPVSRTRLLFEKYAALALPIVLATVVVGTVVYVGSILIDQSLPLERVLAVHLLALPYLFCCGAIGLVLSVIAPRRVVAEAAAIGIVVGGFVVDTLVVGTTLDFLGALTPIRYYDPVSILALGEYAVGDAAVLIAATILLLAVARQLFVRGDIR